MLIEILTQTAINEVIQKIATTAKALQGQIHQCAVSTLSHIAEHGDYRGAAALLNALPTGQRVQALVVWFQHFSDGALQIKKAESGGFAVSLKAGWKDSCSIDVEAAMLTDYAAFTKEAKPATFTVEKLIKMIEDKANNTELNVDGSAKVDPSARGVAAKLVAAYRSMIKAAADSIEVAA